MANLLFETIKTDVVIPHDQVFNVLGVPRFQSFSKTINGEYKVQVKELQIKPAGWGLIGLVAIAAAISTTLLH